MNNSIVLNFKTHTIYITLDDNKLYKVNEDFSKEEVKEIPHPSKENPIHVLHKAQFDFAKSALLDNGNPFKMSMETAIIYNKLGFLSDLELSNFKLLYNV